MARQPELWYAVEAAEHDERGVQARAEIRLYSSRRGMQSDEARFSAHQNGLRGGAVERQGSRARDPADRRSARKGTRNSHCGDRDEDQRGARARLVGRGFRPPKNPHPPQVGQERLRTAEASARSR